MKEIDQNLPIKFTESALKEIIRLNEFEGKNKYLVIGVKQGGCSGLSYVFEFQDLEEPMDSFMVNEVQIYINALDLQYIKNLEVDYEQGLNNRGFTFSNPNANTTCGCGTSFA